MSTELVERLNAGIRYLPRMATEDSAEYRQFCDAGDAIFVNEGDLWNALFAMREAADELTALTEALRVAKSALALLTEPEAIQTTSTQQAWAQAVEAQAHARRALSEPDKEEP